MLINNLENSTQSLELLSGIYYFNLFQIETSDPLDLIRISGDNFQWKYSGELDWREPYNGNEYTEYADTIGQELTILFNVIESGTFNLRTDDTFEYPNDDTPTNPIIDIEILQAGDYSAIAEDWLGSVDNNILSTGDGAVDAVTISNDFFHNNVDLTQYGVEGTAALWVTEPGINKVDVTLDGTAKLLLWDGSNIVPFIVNGSEELYFETVSDEWGFIILDESDSSNIASVEFDNFIWYDSVPSGVDIIKHQEESDLLPPAQWIIEELGDVVVSDIPNYNNGGEFMVGTGTGDRAVSTIGKNLMGDRNYLKPYGTEGSYLKLTDLENGVYEFDVSLYTKDNTNNDTLYVWNGKNLILVADKDNGIIHTTVDVIYGELAFIGVDVTTKTGTTDFTITNLQRTGDLSYPAPIPITLTPDNFLGDVDFYEKQTRINSGTGDRAISTLSTELGIDLTTLGTEGSYGTWNNLENGIYEITYYLYTSENDENHDKIYYYDGSNLNLFADRSSATTQLSLRRWISESTTQQVEVTEGELTFITLDTVDKSGTLQLRINKIEKVGNLSDNDTDNNTDDPYSYIYSEPPYPIPSNNKDLGNDSLTGLNLGVLKPWETDTDTGTEYNQGYIYGSYHLGASYITEFIGGDDYSDYINFSLDESSYLNFYHSNAIAEILDSNNQVIVGSNDSYSGNLQTYLSSGDYSIGFSSEASLPELFNASIYLSNSDPNYAD